MLEHSLLSGCYLPDSVDYVNVRTAKHAVSCMNAAYSYLAAGPKANIVDSRQRPVPIWHVITVEYLLLAMRIALTPLCYNVVQDYYDYCTFSPSAGS